MNAISIVFIGFVLPEASNDARGGWHAGSPAARPGSGRLNARFDGGYNGP